MSQAAPRRTVHRPTPQALGPCDGPRSSVRPPPLARANGHPSRPARRPQDHLEPDCIPPFLHISSDTPLVQHQLRADCIMHLFPLSIFLLSALVSLLPASLAQATITTPASLTTCQPILLTIGGTGTPPYYISVIPGGQVASAALETFPVVNASGGVTWLVNLAAGKLAPIRLGVTTVRTSADTSARVGIVESTGTLVSFTLTASGTYHWV